MNEVPIDVIAEVEEKIARFEADQLTKVLAGEPLNRFERAILKTYLVWERSEDRKSST